MTFEPRQIVDERFETPALLGGNQIGSTSKARTLNDDRKVVIKKLYRQTDEEMELHLQKAQAARQLTQMCDELLTIEEVAVHDQDVFQVLTLLPARSLRRQQPPKPRFEQPVKGQAPPLFCQNRSKNIATSAPASV